MTKPILALDQGTSSSRAIVFEPDGSIRAVAQTEFAQHYPRPGWVEHDPSEIWSTSLQMAQKAIAEAGLEAADLAGIGITNQRETIMLWDRATGSRFTAPSSGRQAYVSASACRQRALRKFGSEPGCCLANISGRSWRGSSTRCRRHLRAERELACGTIDSWLVWKPRMGAYITDAANASRTLLYDIVSGDWSMLSTPSRCRRAVLPEVVDSSGVVRVELGAARRRPAHRWHRRRSASALRPGLPCRVVQGTYGTGCFAATHTGHERVYSKIACSRR